MADEKPKSEEAQLLPLSYVRLGKPLLLSYHVPQAD